MRVAGVGGHPDAPWVVGAFALAIAFAAATQDIAIDAYAVDVLRKEGAEERVINVHQGEPVIFGNDGEYCVVKSGFGLDVAKTADVAASEIVLHDARIDDPAYAFALSRLTDQNLEHTVMGIFRQVSRPTYDDAAREQVTAARDATPHDRHALQSLLRGRDTWTVD